MEVSVVKWIKFTNFVKKKIKIIEDSAETLGGTWKNKHPGYWGVDVFHSFQQKISLQPKEV